MKPFGILVAVTGILTSGIISARAQQTYTITDLGAFEPTRLNDSGQIVGMITGPFINTHAALWQNGVITDLTPSKDTSGACSINDAGQVVGTYINWSSFPQKDYPFLWQNGVLTDLETPPNCSHPGAMAYVINDAGLIGGVGMAECSRNAYAFLWRDGSCSPIGTLGSGYPEHGLTYPLVYQGVYGINATGQAVGFLEDASACSHAFLLKDDVFRDLSLELPGAFNGPVNAWALAVNANGQVLINSPARAYLWEDGVSTDLGSLGGVQTKAVALNDSGQVAGWGYTSGGDCHAFLWDATNGIQDLGTLGGPGSYPTAMNRDGYVVGEADDADGSAHAVVWHSGILTDLGIMGNDWTEPRAINNRGQIVVYCTFSDGSFRGFLATPVNTPAGTNVSTSPAAGTDLTFSSVIEPGVTTVTTTSTAPDLPSGFQTGSTPVYYDIETTATFSGPVEVCISYDPANYTSEPRLLHYQDGAWVDITISVDTTSHILCGQTNGFSPFAIVQRAILTVSIDIKPGSTPNSINLGSNGVVPVAILSTASFDARTVDPASVTLASAPVQLKGKGSPMASVQDVNGDALPDLVVQVSTSALQLTLYDTEAVLQGQTLNGNTLIRGTDSVRVVQ